MQAFALFQFHKGTIKTFLYYNGLLVFLKFQFHKGTIKTNWMRSRSTIEYHFNSIKVQLRHAVVMVFWSSIAISIP